MCILTCCLLTLCAACTQERKEHSASFPVYAKYTDIPGVTKEEIAAIEALKKQRIGFALAMNHSTEAFYRNDKTIGGFTSLLCIWLTDLFGIPFHPEIVEWNELIQGLASREIDFTGELTPTDERRKIYYMTGAIAERTIKRFRLLDSSKLAILATERPLRFAFLEGATSVGYLRKAMEHPFTATYIGDYSEAVRLLRAGSIDAFFEDGSAEAAFDSYTDILAQEHFPVIYTPVALSTGNQDLAPIISVVQKYLDQGALYHLTLLYNEGEEEYRKHKLYLQLAPEEKAYLQAHNEKNPIPIAAEYDNYPISFYNNTENQWQGVALDVLHEISRLTGLSFAIVNKQGANWSKLFDMLSKGEVALITELIPSRERKGRFLWPDDPYTVDQYALISREEHPNIKINQILYSRVALARDSAYEEVFDQWFPDHPHTIRFDSTNETFLAVEDRKADFAMGSHNLMLSMTNYAEKPGFKVNLLFDNRYHSSFGLNKNETTLCSIISKTQKMVDMPKITNQWTHRVFDYNAKLARTHLPYLIGLAIMLVLVLVLLLVLLRRNKRSGKELERLVRQRTAELEVQTEAAKEASKAKSGFLSSMSHEIRTPLNAIIGMAQVCKQIPDLPHKGMDAISKILAASNHLLSLLNDILDMAKIESGKFTLVNESFALLPAVQEVAGIIAQRCEEKEITFITEIQAVQDIDVQGDKLRLKQVLINLLGNAVKFTDQGGVVRFLIALEQESEHSVCLRFLVEDNGIGMSTEQISRLFTAFEQADSAVSIKYGGTGLGLAISQNMVQNMGGKITVKSQPGKGSCFSFAIVLPRVVLAEEDDTPYEDENLDLRGHRFLLVEDITINQLVLMELLADTGVTMDIAEDGVQALEHFRNSKEYYYDLVLMDVQMPKLDGYQATQAIRALPRKDAHVVPIIAMTANAYQEDIDKALASGMNDHIAKPINISTVRKVLRKHLDTHLKQQ